MNTHLTKVFSALLLCLGLFQATPVLAQSSTGTTDAFTFDEVLDLDTEHFRGRGCYFVREWECALDIFGGVFEQERNVQFMAERSSRRLCSFVREIDLATVRIVEAGDASASLVRIRNYERLMQKMASFEINENAESCVRQSREVTGAYLLLRRAAVCDIISDDQCTIDALVELAIADDKFTWEDVGIKLELDGKALKSFHTRLRSLHGWTIELEKRKRMSDLYSLGFFSPSN